MLISQLSQRQFRVLLTVQEVSLSLQNQFSNRCQDASGSASLGPDIDSNLTLLNSFTQAPPFRSSSPRMESNPGPLEIGGQAENAIFVKTSFNTRRCGRFCGCQCHVRTQLCTPRPFSRIFGLLLYNYSGTFLPGSRPCNNPRCQSRGHGASQFTYLFPRWMISRAISIMSNYGDLSGIGASWTVRLPRVIPFGARIWTLVESGDLKGVQEEFAKNHASPFDVEEHGWTLLHVCPKCPCNEWPMSTT
jgi:hypothetical protein